MKTRIVSLLGAALLLGVAFVPAASASSSGSCSLSVNQPEGMSEECTFSCTTGDIIVVSATANAGTITISGACGGASAGCGSNASTQCTDASKGPATAAGGGKCVLSATDGNTVNDSGTGSCSVKRASVPEPNEECAVPADPCPVLCPAGVTKAIEDILRVKIACNLDLSSVEDLLEP